MADSEIPVDDPAAEKDGKSSKLVPILSVVLCLVGIGAGYFAVSTGLIPLAKGPQSAQATQEKPAELPDVAFVEIPTLIVTLPPGAANTHLRFSGQIEVRPEYREDIEFLMPRIQDFLNGYLRALSAEDVEGQGALFRIRVQMFRRIVAIVGLGKVNNLLVTEFILN
ncbi:flagellar basal body-associated FliL family protein [Marivita sp. S6314]|uniref:flagellar basal body-associated FliL family protein n=1 Tax=Marivita sp. S6314 TaxID=2926406 RepID=UPI001FF1C29A|nr:flagellar basal body-associated FliL family protein [Marivita sp. S6314]MCK0151829.1 flagellar basal body-associated FliL family protein [Marivita sp. S6314]